MNKGVRTIIDVDGDLVPASMIPSLELKRHDMIEGIIDEAKTLNWIMKEFKKKTNKMITDYLSQVAEQYGEHWKGNATLWNYGKTKAIEVNIQNQLQFDERLQLAKEKIYNCIERWSTGASENIIVLVKKAFDTDKQGLVDTKRILTLTTLKIIDEEWKEAIEIIRESIIKTGSKRYINFKTKEEDLESLKTISLNYSSI